MSTGYHLADWDAVPCQCRRAAPALRLALGFVDFTAPNIQQLVDCLGGHLFRLGCNGDTVTGWQLDARQDTAGVVRFTGSVQYQGCGCVDLASREDERAVA